MEHKINGLFLSFTDETKPQDIEDVINALRLIRHINCIYYLELDEKDIKKQVLSDCITISYKSSKIIEELMKEKEFK